MRRGGRPTRKTRGGSARPARAMRRGGSARPARGRQMARGGASRRPARGRNTRRMQQGGTVNTPNGHQGTLSGGYGIVPGTLNPASAAGNDGVNYGPLGTPIAQLQVGSGFRQGGRARKFQVGGHAHQQTEHTHPIPTVQSYTYGSGNIDSSHRHNIPMTSYGGSTSGSMANISDGGRHYHNQLTPANRNRTSLQRRKGGRARGRR